MAVQRSLSHWYRAVKYPLFGKLFYLPHSRLACGHSVSVFCRSTTTSYTVRLFHSNVRCTGFAICACNCAFSVRSRCADNRRSPLQTKASKLILETNFRIKNSVPCLLRTFSVMPRNFLARHKDENPGSEAIFRQEMKNMKEKEHVMDDLDEENMLKKWTQDYVNRGTATKYAKRAKYLGQERRERTLTWDNIDQIRFLRQEHPDEWSVIQLARSFNVSEQTIKKVLKSKYTPDSQTKQHQDNIAVRNVGKNIAVPPSTDTNTDHILLEEGSNFFSKKKPEKESEDNVDNRRKNSVKDNPNRNFSKVNLEETEELASIGGQHWEEDENIDLEEELEEAEAFSSLTAADFVKVFDEGVEAPKVVQRGKEFYDSDGEFLFKI